jgi:hypothetical protein
MLQRRLLLVGGLVLAVVLALWARPGADDDRAGVASGKGPAQTRPPPSMGAPAPFASTTPLPGEARPPAAQREPSAAPNPAVAPVAVPISVAAPRTLQVGETGELVIGLGPNAAVAEVAFVVQFDSSILQVRAGTEGEWAARAGSPARFSVEISSGEDRIDIRSTLLGEATRVAGGSVAVVQFQAIAPGTTSVLISEVAVKDPSGRRAASAVSSSNLQMTVESARALSR